MSLFPNATCHYPALTPNIIQCPTTFLMGLTSRSKPHNILNGSHIWNGPLPSASKCKFAPSSSGGSFFGTLMRVASLELSGALMVAPSGSLLGSLFDGYLGVDFEGSLFGVCIVDATQLLRNNTMFIQKQTRTPHVGCVLFFPTLSRARSIWAAECRVRSTRRGWRRRRLATGRRGQRQWATWIVFLVSFVFYICHPSEITNILFVT